MSAAHWIGSLLNDANSLLGKAEAERSEWRGGNEVALALDTCCLDLRDAVESLDMALTRAREEESA